MRWLVTGAAGMLGRDTVAELARRGEDVTGLDRAALDVTRPDAVEDAVAAHRPDLVVNCAAYTAVDAAEHDELRALRVNGDGPAHLARACARHGARLVHVSTDYVFPGTARTPYPEDAPPAPRTAYGRTKLAGERAVLTALPDACAVVRTAWLYGAHGSSFVRTGLPDQPEFSWWITRTRSSAAASPSRRAGVPSVEPSSTKITSYASRGSDWRSRDATHSSM